jgi:hypothetical protein
MVHPLCKNFYRLIRVGEYDGGVRFDLGGRSGVVIYVLKVLIIGTI